LRRAQGAEKEREDDKKRKKMNPSIPLRPRVKLDYSLFHEDSKFNRWLKTRRTRNLFLKEKAASNKKATGSAEKNKSKKENVELNDKAGDKMF